MQASYASHVAPPQGERSRFPFLKLYFLTAIVMLLADWIGSVTFNVGPGKVVLLPMVWAILMGGVLGLLHKSMPAPLRLDTSLQFRAASVLQPALLLFIAVVAPDVMWEGAAPGAFDVAREKQAHAHQRQIFAGRNAKGCKPL